MCAVPNLKPLSRINKIRGAVLPPMPMALAPRMSVFDMGLNALPMFNNYGHHRCDALATRLRLRTFRWNLVGLSRAYIVAACVTLNDDTCCMLRAPRRVCESFAFPA